MINRVLNSAYILRTLFAGVLLTVLIFGASCSPQRVQTVKDEAEANEILDVLLAHGIKAGKVEAGEGEKRVYEIQIGGGDEEYAAAIQLMDDHCIPQRMPAEIESSGIVSSLEVEKARELRRIKINIESQLRKMPGATCVSVNLVQPEDKSLSLNPYPASASVLLKYKTEKFDMNTAQIANTVARSVPGLSADNVFVTISRQPLRPLPNLDRGRNIRRIMWIAGLGITTILFFVALILFMRRRSVQTAAEIEMNDQRLLEEQGGFEAELQREDTEQGRLEGE